MESDKEYFARRAASERAAAAEASHPAAQLAHSQMAARYDDMAAAIRRHDQVLGVRTAAMDGQADQAARGASPNQTL